MFKFARFPGKGRGYESRASIRRSGQIGFNTGSVMHYNLTDFHIVNLHYDDANKAIGIELIEEGGDGTECTMIHRPGNTYIAAKTFFDWFQIPLAEGTSRYKLWKDDASGFLIIELDKPIKKKGGQQQDIEAD